VIGEAERPVELVGVFKAVADTALAGEPRRSYVCPRCRWANVFREKLAVVASVRAIA
jgi:hypothetical protein